MSEMPWVYLPIQTLWTVRAALFVWGDGRVMPACCVPVSCHAACCLASQQPAWARRSTPCCALHARAKDGLGSGFLGFPKKGRS